MGGGGRWDWEMGGEGWGGRGGGVRKRVEGRDGRGGGEKEWAVGGRKETSLQRPHNGSLAGALGGWVGCGQFSSQKPGKYTHKCGKL